VEITFDAYFAEKLGLNEAIILSILETLIQEVGIECEGSKWIALSYERLNELLPFMSYTTIRRTVYSLERQGAIKTKTARGRKWYALNIQNGKDNDTSGKTLVQNEHNSELTQKEHDCKDFDTALAQSKKDTPEIQAFLKAVQNERPNNNNCRKINYYDQDNLKPDQVNLIQETTRNINNTLDQEKSDQNRLSLQEIKNLLSDYDIEISWNKRAWQALKQLAALTRDEILKLAKRLFSLQCEGVIKNPAGLLVAKPAEIIRAFFTDTLYPSHRTEYERSEYFPLYVYAVS